MTTIKPRMVGDKDKAIGERIRTQRLAIGMSQEELGSHLGISFQQVQKYEKGVNRTSAVRLSEIAEVLGTNAVSILDGVDGDSKSKSTPISRFVSTKVGVDLIEAMLAIKDPSVRQAVVSLAQALRTR
ncbi:helix-turn-helix transcriptional regulator [Tardiphaga sp. vice352]|uniref:helix-turn-helix domain-containing protein n=1 Tax=unclassified Tardiphaga TaxID=2631404 RepID=UPI0011639BF1|nr:MULTISPECIES: helix-turn-helix transcriptional regulator [unclassified Tardiphaga]QDM18091.1 helix-turn-helix transcriptional regulator [Tardiphaga sp. vice278]QDM23127.1 helix-turn-helix transcriptional regulator [Tardiphaga sp. vice154]QDM28299.1 helix-turn-helix transcriptional regulator [Tardiphaga sp. vice304]QDM33438.1 helix-turn-helix transcriptional regulator [Tardiphaga sp. vice352]